VLCSHVDVSETVEVVVALAGEEVGAVAVPGVVKAHQLSAGSHKLRREAVEGAGVVEPAVQRDPGKAGQAGLLPPPLPGSDGAPRHGDTDLPHAAARQAPPCTR